MVKDVAGVWKRGRPPKLKVPSVEEAVASAATVSDDSFRIDDLFPSDMLKYDSWADCADDAAEARPRESSQ